MNTQDINWPLVIACAAIVLFVAWMAIKWIDDRLDRGLSNLSDEDLAEDNLDAHLERFDRIDSDFAQELGKVAIADPAPKSVEPAARGGRRDGRRVVSTNSLGRSREWPSMEACAAYLGVSGDAVRKALRNKHKCAGHSITDAQARPAAPKSSRLSPRYPVNATPVKVVDAKNRARIFASKEACARHIGVTGPAVYSAIKRGAPCKGYTISLA